MSDKEKALDALQQIINLTTCHTMSAVNDEVIKQSEIIKKALAKVPLEPITSEVHIICHYTPGRSVPIPEAKAWHSPGDQNCLSCGGRCL